MYLIDNPVLQRELLANLRMGRAFVLLLLYQLLLGAVVYFAWPQESRLDLTEDPESTRQLVDLFFLGQYILASLMAPSFASAAITGEKEKQTYEMLLASPLQPEAIVLGKLLAALAHLSVLIFASLPIVMLCLPLGGVSLYEVLAAYLALMISVVTFGMISITCSSVFQRNAASLVVSYMLILPLALLGIVFWQGYADQGETRLTLTITVVPGIGAAICIALFYITSARLLYPPDVGSEGKDVIDLEREQENAIGLVIQPHRFPDRLFAPPKRTTLMGDHANPVLDKEIRSEIFSNGTRMHRMVIQLSMFLAIPMMALLYVRQELAYVYVGFVVLFNVLVGPVFNAGSITSERERQTLDLLLTTTITPWQILWGKLLAGLRVSTVLTSFLLWPVLLATLMVPTYWRNLLAVVAFLVIVLMACVTTAIVALFCSTVFRKTTISLTVTYLMISIMFFAPIAVVFFTSTFFGDHPVSEKVERVRMISPFMAAYDTPLHVEYLDDTEKRYSPPSADTADFLGYRFSDWYRFLGYLGITAGLNLTLLILMIWLFHSRWRVARLSPSN